MRRVVKYASTCTNHTSGSDGQNGGSFTETVANAAGAVASTCSGVSSSAIGLIPVEVTNVGDDRLVLTHY